MAIGYTMYIHKGRMHMQIEDKVIDGLITFSESFRHKTLEERTSEYDGKLDLDGEFDWGEPVGKEIW